MAFNPRQQEFEAQQWTAAKQERLENARILAEERIRERQLRLSVMQDRDRELDKQLLFDGIDLNTPAELWFISKDMTGGRACILQYMGAILKGHLSKDVLQEIEQLASNMEWIKQPFPGHPVVWLGHKFHI